MDLKKEVYLCQSCNPRIEKSTTNVNKPVAL